MYYSKSIRKRSQTKLPSLEIEVSKNICGRNQLPIESKVEMNHVMSNVHEDMPVFESAKICLYLKVP